MFTDTQNPPYIFDGETYQADSLTICFGTTSTWRRVITTSNYRRTWLDKVSASEMAAAIIAADSSGNTTASPERMADNGAYQVKVTTITQGAWAQDT